jgi:polysaccharide deacetylase 2 family uncharacterized protein YibQ
MMPSQRAADPIPAGIDRPIAKSAPGWGIEPEAIAGEVEYRQQSSREANVAAGAAVLAPAATQGLSALGAAVEPVAMPSVSDGIGSPELPLWIKNSVASALPPRQPAIAIVLDDVGVARGHADMAIALPPAITLSFMTYAQGVDAMAAKARQGGHELMLHFPMEPLDSALDAGPNTLMVGLNRAELLRRLDWGLSRFGGYIGVNNHMGSRFTNDPQGMRVVLEELKRRGLLFLDSRTSAKSVGEALSRAIDLAHASRDVFLDNEISTNQVDRQLHEAERVALEKGDAIAIGHPHPATIEAIRAWIPQAQAKGIAIVPLSAVVRRRLGYSG